MSGGGHPPERRPHDDEPDAAEDGRIPSAPTASGTARSSLGLRRYRPRVAPAAPADRGADPDRERLVAALERDTGAVVARTHDEMARVLPELSVERHPELEPVLDANSSASFRLVLRGIRAGEAPTALAPEAVDEARLCARIGVPVEVLLRSYRIGHEVGWQSTLDAVDRVLDDPAVRRRVLAVCVRVFYGYLDVASDQLPRIYAETATAGGLVDAVRGLLSGGRDDLPRAGYGVDGTHCCTIAWGTDPVGTLRGATDGGPQLVVPVTDGLAWSWSRTAPADLAPPSGTSVAVGEPGRDVAGFRESHRDALRAQGVATRLGLSIARYRDVALEAFALRERDEAARMVAVALGPLDADEPTAERGRETLRAYLSSGQSAAAAAAVLGVSDRTAAYRVRAVEDLLGFPVRTRAADLATALRWRAVLRG
jgi:hypothetical protein